MSVPTNFQERQRALEDRRRDLAEQTSATLRLLDTARAQAHEKERRERQQFEAECAAHHVALEEALAKETVAALNGACAIFARGERRGGTMAIRDAWRVLDAKCREQLGAPLAEHHLALAFAEAHGLALKCSDGDFFLHAGLYNAPTACAGVTTAIERGIAIPQLEELCAVAERMVTARCSISKPSVEAEAILSGLRSRCTSGAMRAEAARRAVEYAANATPTGKRVVFLGGLGGTGARGVEESDPQPA